MELQKLRKYLLKVPPHDLGQLRDDIAKLLDAYANDGIPFGQPTIELKTIKKKVVVDFQKGEDGKMHAVTKEILCGPYLYIRQWIIDNNGKLSLTTNGYYGKSGVAALDRGKGDELLAAHARGGEPEGDDFLMDLGLPPPGRHKKADDLIPIERPTHPLNDESITLETLQNSPIFQYFQKHAPIDAAELVTKITNFRHDLAHWQFAETKGLIFRESNTKIEKKRQRAKRKQGNPIK